MPASFVALLSTGALMAGAGLAIPLVEPVIAALRATKIKGKRQTVRRDMATSRN